MNWTDFHFIRPIWLLMLIPYLALLIFLVRRKLNQGNWAAVCDVALLPYLLQDKIVKQSRWPLAAGALGALLAIIALAGPTWQRLPTPVFRNDSALVIALDLSSSMNAADLKPSRLTLARYKIADILKRRKDGQTALLVFAADAFTVTPLTNDTQTIDSQLSALTTGIMPSGGDNIALALKKAEDLLKQAGLQKGQILLITDGGDIEEGVSQAKNLGAYQLLVMGAGTDEGAPIALETGGFQKDAQGGIMVAKTDGAGLEKLARAGNGSYHILTPDDSDINALLSSVPNKLQQQGEPRDNLLLEQWNDMGPWLLLLVLPFAALSFRKGLLAISLVALIPFPNDSYAQDWQWRDFWQTKDQQAQEAFNNKQYDKAAELFENPDWKAASQYKADTIVNDSGELPPTKTATGFYNQGNLLARAGESKQNSGDYVKAKQDYIKAIAKYSNALNLSPEDKLKDDIKENQRIVQNALEKLEEKQKQQDQEKKSQSKNDKNGDKQQDSKDGNQQNNQQQDGKDKQEQKDNNSAESGQQDKPEKKPERKAEDMPDNPKEEQKNQQPEQAKADQTKPEQAEKKDNKPDAANAEPLTEATKEQRQANEQWLNRIPDDPAGLLRRKFRYQYDRRYRQQ